MKAFKLFILRLLKVMGFFALMRYATRRGVRIICYHGIWLGDEGFPGNCQFMKEKTFASRLECLRKWRFPVISLNQAVTGLSNNNLPSCPVVLTIDDGWYGSYVGMLPILFEHGMPATLYCDTANLLSGQPIPHVMAFHFKALIESGCEDQVTLLNSSQMALYEAAIQTHGSIADRLKAVHEFADSVSIDFDGYVSKKVFNYMSSEQLAAAYKSGLDVQLHTHNHTLHDFSKDAMVREIELNRFNLSEITGVEADQFCHLCYPSGTYDPGSSAVLDGLGILSATTIKRGISYPATKRHFLPRFLDAENLTSIEIEADLSGVTQLLGTIRRLLHV